MTEVEPVADVLIAGKKTTKDHYREDDRLDELTGKELDRVEEGHENHYRSLDRLEDALERYDMDYEVAQVEPDPETDRDLATQDYDLVVSLGGDGTLLSTAYHVDDTPVLPITSDPGSTGAMCQYDHDEIEHAVEDYVEENVTHEQWTRLRLETEDCSDVALNDVFIGREKSFQVAEYEIKLGEVCEEHMNSGMVVATGRGSTGWYRNIEGSAGRFDPEADELRFVEREPIGDSGQELNAGRLDPGEELVLRSRMDVGGVISPDGDDGDRLYDFLRGDELRVSLAEQPLRVVVSDPG